MPRQNQFPGQLPPRTQRERVETPRTRQTRRQPRSWGAIASVCGITFLFAIATGSWLVWSAIKKQIPLYGTSGEFQTFTLPNGGFSIDLPGTPEERIVGDQPRTPGNSLYYITSADRLLWVSILKSNLPPEKTAGRAEHDLIDPVTKTASFGKGNLSVTPILFEGHEGRELRYDGGRWFQHGVDRVFVNDNAVYVVEILFRGDQQQDIINRIFNSIRFD